MRDATALMITAGVFCRHILWPIFLGQFILHQGFRGFTTTGSLLLVATVQVSETADYRAVILNTPRYPMGTEACGILLINHVQLMSSLTGKFQLSENVFMCVACGFWARNRIRQISTFRKCLYVCSMRALGQNENHGSANSDFSRMSLCV